MSRPSLAASAALAIAASGTAFASGSAPAAGADCPDFRATYTCPEYKFPEDPEHPGVENVQSESAMEVRQERSDAGVTKYTYDFAFKYFEENPDPEHPGRHYSNGETSLSSAEASPEGVKDFENITRTCADGVLKLTYEGKPDLLERHFVSLSPAGTRDYVVTITNPKGTREVQRCVGPRARAYRLKKWIARLVSIAK